MRPKNLFVFEKQQAPRDPAVLKVSVQTALKISNSRPFGRLSKIIQMNSTGFSNTSSNFHKLKNLKKEKKEELILKEKNKKEIKNQLNNNIYNNEDYLNTEYNETSNEFFKLCSVRYIINIINRINSSRGNRFY